MSNKQFTKAELENLTEKARNANMAGAIYNDFLNFLRRQHEAPEQEGWQLGERGFELNKTPPPAMTGEGMNGILAEEMERFN